MQTNSNNNSTLIYVGVLLLGLIVGFYFGNGQNQNSLGVHTMPDGTVMDNQAMDMSQMMADMNKALMGKTGDAFDKAFLSEMIVHHEGAVEMAKMAEKNAKHQEIKDLASAIISAQNKEISDMRGWLKAWYNLDN